MATEATAFDVGDYVVYPKHGVGRVIELQNEEIAGMQLELYVLRFEKERMTLRVPTNKVEAIGMRKLSSDKTLKEAMETLKGKPKVNQDRIQQLMLVGMPQGETMYKTLTSKKSKTNFEIFSHSINLSFTSKRKVLLF